MASQDHIRLACLIKSVHQNLRVESQRVGENRAWENHCQRKHVLREYANAMQQLAVEFWEKNSADVSNQKAKCRVQWIVDQCMNYHFKGGNCQAHSKEIALCEKLGLGGGISHFKQFPATIEASDKLKVLDVGSCYNPFGSFPKLDVIPIDIAPASNDVLQCDFLNVKVSEAFSLSSSGSVYELPTSYFEVVIFSLLLEYFPSSKQRYNCCKKACEVLKPGGILCIVTPDSKHATANSKIMKDWRYALAGVGLLRIHYDKLPHLHCMVYRKCVNPKVGQQWLMKRALSLIKPPEQLMVIPQDSHSQVELLKDIPKTKISRDADEIIASAFRDLPQFCE